MRIDGIDVGGLSASAATSRRVKSVALSMELLVLGQLAQRQNLADHAAPGSVVVDVAGTVHRRCTQPPRVDLLAHMARALRRERQQGHAPAGELLPAGAARLRRRSARGGECFPAHATVQPGESGLTEVPDRAGVAVEQRRLTARVAAALTGPFAKRAVAVPTLVRKPAVTTGELAARYPAYIVDQPREVRAAVLPAPSSSASSYPIAVGMQGLETTAGLYHIHWKQTDPPGTCRTGVGGGARGQDHPAAPKHPLKARFMAFNGGAGIHGIDPSEYSTIGHDASHGCVRMRIPDVIALYSRTPVGTPVYVI